MYSLSDICKVFRGNERIRRSVAWVHLLYETREHLHIFVGQSDSRISLDRFRSGQKNNIAKDFKHITYICVNWVDVVHDKLMDHSCKELIRGKNFIVNQQGCWFSGNYFSSFRQFF